MLRRPARSPLFPYTTLFRSRRGARQLAEGMRQDRRITVSAQPSRLRDEVQNGAELRRLPRWQKAGVACLDHEIGRAPSELQSRLHLVCRLLLEKKKQQPASS